MLPPLPPPAVVERFGLRGDARAVPGGEGVTFRVGDVVLKRVHDEAETEWVQSLLARVEPDGFRVAEPLATLDGAWVHEGWSACAWIDGLRPAAPAWGVVVAAGLRFGEAAEAARLDGREVLSRRTHRWAVADRVAWGEEAVALGSDAAVVRDLLSELHGMRSLEDHFVHGDLAGNVHIDDNDVPVVLDVSPYLRPRRWAAAIVVTDAVLWMDAPTALAQSFAEDAGDRDLLGRAAVYRLVAEQLAAAPRHGARLEPYLRLASALGLSPT